MPVLPRIVELQDELIGWRRQLHSFPELCYEERQTADFIAARLTEMGLAVHRGLGKTGVVGTLTVGNGGGTVGIRADIDALPIHEFNKALPYRSRHDGKMHACGHDGHTAMALGAARYLAETRDFRGTVHFVFQPAEEGGAGAKAMIDDGLFERFPMQALYAIHNRPGLATGRISLHKGFGSSAASRFKITVQGRDAHAAMPQQGVDGLMIGAKLVDALLTIVARNVNPNEMGAIALTEFKSGVAPGVIPGLATLAGTFRSYNPKVQAMLDHNIRRTVENLCAAYGAKGEIEIVNGYPSLFNDASETEFAAGVAEEIVGPDMVDRNGPPSLASEDFSFYTQHIPCAYVWLGNGDGAEACMVHNEHYDFNDTILATGSSYFARLIERRLPKEA